MRLEDKTLNKSLFLIQLIASLLVVLGHYTATVFDYRGHTAWLDMLNQLSRYGTVLLAIITGFFTARTFEHKNPTAWGFFSGKIKYIFIPFLLSGFLYHYLLFYEIPTSMEAFTNIWLGKTGGHLYFVFMLCQYYLIAYLLRNLINRKNLLFLIWIFIAIQYTYIHYIHPFIVSHTHGFLGLSTRHLFPAWIFTFYAGHLIYWYRDGIIALIKKRNALLILLTTFSILSMAYFVLSSTMYSAVHLIFVFASIVSLLVAAVFFLETEKFIKITFRKGFTFYIYLLHSAVIIILNRILVWKLGFTWIFQNKWYIAAYFIVIYLTTLFLSIGIVKIIQRLESIGRRKRIDLDVGQQN